MPPRVVRCTNYLAMSAIHDSHFEVVVPKRTQRQKIRQIGQALVQSGYTTLDAQAKVLGLSRSTVWTILTGQHKTSGLSARVIQTMLSSPELPPLVRDSILDYVAKKASGVFGGNAACRKRFIAQLSRAGISCDHAVNANSDQPRQSRFGR